MEVAVFFAVDVLVEALVDCVPLVGLTTDGSVLSAGARPALPAVSSPFAKSGLAKAAATAPVARVPVTISETTAIRVRARAGKPISDSCR